jgi:hypothetical protein
MGQPQASALKRYLMNIYAVTTSNISDIHLSILSEIGRRISAHTSEQKSTSYLLQRLSIDVQRGNAAAVFGTIRPSAALGEVYNIVS